MVNQAILNRPKSKLFWLMMKLLRSGNKCLPIVMKYIKIKRKFTFNFLVFGAEKMNSSAGQNVILNFGPQHPAAHGVLRLILELDGEVL